DLVALPCKLFPRVGNVEPQLAGRLAQHEGAAATRARDQPFAFEKPERLAHRSARNAELAREIVEHRDALANLPLARPDVLAEQHDELNVDRRGVAHLEQGVGAPHQPPTFMRSITRTLSPR